MNNLKSDDTINILERIAHFYVDLEGFEWTDFLSGKPEDYDNMQFLQKVNFTFNILYKLEYLLDNPKDTLIRWMWNCKKLHHNFDDFLSHQFEMIPDRESPIPEKYRKTQSCSIYKRIVSIVKRLREGKLK